LQRRKQTIIAMTLKELRETIADLARVEGEAATARYKLEAQLRALVTEAILTSDKALNNYARRRGVPLVRASVYKTVTRAQEVELFPRDDPRRPVVMRGALEMIYNKYKHTQFRTLPDGTFEQIHKSASFLTMIIARYLRYFNYTSQGPDAHAEYVYQLADRLVDKHPELFARFSANRPHWDRFVTEYDHDAKGWAATQKYSWINGVRVELPASQKVAAAATLPWFKSAPQANPPTRDDRLVAQAVRELGLLDAPSGGAEPPRRVKPRSSNRQAPNRRQLWLQRQKAVQQRQRRKALHDNGHDQPPHRK
jgi:hypothetical protein